MPVLEELREDDLALAVGRAVAAANKAALAHGKDLDASLITITEEAPPPQRLWRVHYGPREYVLRRGGDLIVFVEEQTGNVQRVVRGQ